MQRLKTRAQFQAVLAAGTVARTAHFALHRLPLPPAPLADTVPPGPPLGPSGPAPDAVQALFGVDGCWLGAMTPKRWARRAVTRNAIRRQVYAVGQTFGLRLPCAAHVVRLRAGFDRKAFVSAWSEPLRLLVRAELLQLFERAAAQAGQARAPSPAGTAAGAA